MFVISTRGAGGSLSATEAVLEGISKDGGLFVPAYFPQIDLKAMERAAQEGYPALCAAVLAEYLDMSRDDLLTLAGRAYAGFDTPEVAPLKELGSGEYVLELHHGPTLAFKDMALQILPRLMSAALELHHRDRGVLVLTATSGDTGKAALEGFRDVPRTAIYVFYPNEGVSPMQKLQMITQDGSNTGVCAGEGNFDDAQTGVKELFADAAFRAEAADAGYTLSSANSINFGRLAPQVAYYVYAYARLVNEGRIQTGEPVNFCVPTGNFGNILAAYYAKRMGVPVGRLICASNRNNVLTDFFRRGNYDARRDFYKTMSPSMDILISSNLERLLFEISGRDAGMVRAWMDSLKKTSAYEVPADVRKQIEHVFYADSCTEDETSLTIRDTFRRSRCLMDTHTAVAQRVYEKYLRETGDGTATVVVSTANPYKFPQDVLRAVTGAGEADAFAAAQKLRDATGTDIPPQILELRGKPALHTGVAAKGGQIGAVRAFISGRRK
jgi:threonine synthase